MSEVAPDFENTVAVQRHLMMHQAVSRILVWGSNQGDKIIKMQQLHGTLSHPSLDSAPCEVIFIVV